MRIVIQAKFLILIICVFISSEAKSSTQELICFFTENNNKKINTSIPMNLNKRNGYFCPFSYENCSSFEFEETSVAITSKTKPDQNNVVTKFILNRYDASIEMIRKSDLINETWRGRCYDQKNPRF